MLSVEINYLAVVVAAVVNVVISATWYSPALFANRWMAAIGKTEEQVRRDFSPLKPVAALVGGLVTALVMSTVISWAAAAGFVEGALVGLMVAVGFLIPMNGVNYLFEHRPRKLFLINAGHDLTNLVVMGVILGAWRLPAV